jgi:3-hydroxybutyryl-CoA dehydrogenase
MVTTEMDNSGKIAVVGAGFMGCVIATLYARHGYQITLNDVVPAMLDTFAERARPFAESLADQKTPADTILSNIRLEADLRIAVDGAFLVQEVVQEDLDLKQNIFTKLDKLCAPSVILATNTSSYLLTDICRDVEHRARVIGIHYITPAHIVPVVEIITMPSTPPELAEWARGFLRTIDKVGVVCAERPAFLVNRLQYALLAEAYRLLDEGMATRDDIDTAVRLSLGPRLALWGPLLTEDLVVNKRTVLSVSEYLNRQTGDAIYAPRKILKDLIADGRLGAAVGKGWYDFSAEYGSILQQRDAQLSELLVWLRERKALDAIGIA